ncbi:hypothetical protein D6C80_09013 [Aureobasidium pullulans]|nr:hypothetical protein D6C95_00926 [Aureobasidium pullulans]TIA08800.1 hypothetical protein D6C80_09013 [Aureobasidium pullulans]
MFFQPNNPILRTRFYTCPHDEGPYVISFAGEKGCQHEEQRLVRSERLQVGYRGNGQHQKFSRAHHQQHSPSDLGCNITTGNTRSSDVLDLPFSGVTLVIGRILGPYDNEDGYYNEGEDDFYHGDRNSDYYRR